MRINFEIDVEANAHWIIKRQLKIIGSPPTPQSDTKKMDPSCF